MYKIILKNLILFVVIAQVNSDDYERGENITMSCGIDATLTMIRWHHNYTSPSQAGPVVVTWIDGNPPQDTGQWTGRTQLDIVSGNLTLNTLDPEDDGTYTCRANFIPDVQFPSLTGWTHQVNVVG